MLPLKAIKSVDEFLFASVLAIRLCFIPNLRQAFHNLSLTRTLALMGVCIGQIVFGLQCCYFMLRYVVFFERA